MNLKGVVIEESLEDKDVLKDLKITGTRIEPVTVNDQTPWLKVWTLHDIEVPEEHAERNALELSRALDSEHDWYADFKNDLTHFIIFHNKVFKIDRKSFDQYKEASDYGISLGIPEHQVDFTKGVIK